MKHKKLFVTSTVIFTILLTLIIFITIWFWGDNYADFADFRSETEIPGLDDGACPQGVASYRADYTEEDEDGKTVSAKQDYFFISSYLKDEPSRIYVTGKNTGAEGYVTMKTAGGEIFKGHCGGVATNGDYLWVASDGMVYVAKKSSSSYKNIADEIIKKAKENGEIAFTEEFNANCNASFCYYYDHDGDPSTISTSYDKLYVGEFYRSGNYETDKLHHLTSFKGDEHRAFAYEYSISTSNKFGLTMISNTNLSEDKRVPRIQSIYSIPNEIQGFARTRYDSDTTSEDNNWKGGLVLSQSYGLKNSTLLYYDWNAITAISNRKQYKELTYTEKNDKNEDVEVKYGGFAYEGVTFDSGAPYVDDSSNLYVYFADESCLINKYSIPSMSEGLCVVKDRVYVLFESGAKKYRLFVRQILDSIYSFIPRHK